MMIRKHRTALTMALLLMFSLIGSALHAQQSQQNRQTQRTAMGVQLSENVRQGLFIDEMGLNLSLEKFYEGYLDIATYTLGTGDLLGISLEGNVSASLRGIRVNSQGSIIIPEVGIIKVQGMLLDEAEQAINRQLSEKLRDTRASIYLEHPRSIKVHLVGSIPYSGPHVVLAQTRLDQAIFYAFFPPPTEENLENPQFFLANKYPVEFIEQNRYALRNITINREDGSVIDGDLIRYLRTGDKSANPIIEEGDVIIINRFYEYSPRVSVSGAVNRALELEYREDDSIDRLIRMAGGVTFDAAESHIRVARLGESGLTEVVLRDSSDIAGFSLRANDRIVVPFDEQKRGTQNVQVYGELKITGRFPIEDGKTTLYELLQLTGGFTDQALPQAAFLLRLQPGKTEYGLRPAFDPASLVRTSDQFQQGFDYLELESQLISNRVYVDFMDDEQLKSVILYDGDRLHIPKNEGTVFVFGQVNDPGYYNFDAALSHRDYIQNAGNFALSADEERVFVIKSGSNSWFRPENTVIQPGDLVFVDRVPFDELQAARNYDLQKRSQRNSNIQLIMTGLTTITSIITAYVAISRN
ncbi:SLBB domain-containing protein [Balneolales bacterium ANBcel1]|nr:SLBB domain-containing protein [Balneolales bacterium ANBcel1]